MARYGQHLIRAERAPHDEALLALALMTTPGIGPRRLADLLTKVDTLGLSVGDLTREHGAAYLAGLGVHELDGKRLAESVRLADALLRRLSESGIAIIRPDHQPYPPVDVWDPMPPDRTYPTQLLTTSGGSAPRFLFAAGDLDLLLMPGVGFCGSRSASDRAIEAVTDSANDLAQHQVNVISGYAKGVDQAAHEAALRAGGVTTMVLAEGILNFRSQRELAGLVRDHNTLILSQFPPSMPWSVGNAMTRNETICALADALVVVESQLTGGTFAAGNSALKLGRPLFVVDYGGGAETALGNRYFLEKGARPLRRSRSTGRPNTDALISDAQIQARKDSYRVSRLSSLSALGHEKSVRDADDSPLTLWEVAPKATRARGRQSKG